MSQFTYSQNCDRLKCAYGTVLPQCGSLSGNTLISAHKNQKLFCLYIQGLSLVK